MSEPHVVTYTVDGRSATVLIPGEVDPFKLLAHIFRKMGARAVPNPESNLQNKHAFSSSPSQGEAKPDKSSPTPSEATQEAPEKSPPPLFPKLVNFAELTPEEAARVRATPEKPFFSDDLFAAPQGIAELKPQEVSASSQPLAEVPATQDRPAVAAPVKVRDTSIKAYRALKLSGQLAAQQQKIVDYLLANPKMRFTRKEISEDLGLEINAVTGRVAELLAEPLNVLVEVGEKQCRVTGRFVNALQLAQLTEEAA